MSPLGGTPERGGRIAIDPATGSGTYGLLNTLVVPRPIAWVSTRSPGGVDNLAPHSYFTVSSVAPPVVQWTSVGTKDSLRNVLATGEFVVSVCTEELAEAVNATSVDAPPDVSEFDLAGLTREPSARVAPPRVAESPVALECRLVDTVSFGAATVVFGEVVWVAVRPEVVRDDAVDVRLLRPVARLGGREWSRLGEVFALRRPRWEEGR